jgi:tRNA(adenine34) deaminase
MNFMNQAFLLAKKAQSHGDVPIGAIIVKDGKIIARGENRVQKSKNPTLHAEVLAINKACKKLNTKFLDGCDIYVTLEPCSMCATAISFARIQNIYFAARDEKGGGITSNAKVFENDKHLWKPNVIQTDEYAEESAKMLKDFFKERRLIKKLDF